MGTLPWAPRRRLLEIESLQLVPGIGALDLLERLFAINKHGDGRG